MSDDSTAYRISAAAPIIPTGNFLVKFENNLSTSARKKILQLGNNRHVATTSDFRSRSLASEEIAKADAVLLENIGVAILRGINSGVRHSVAVLGETSGVKTVIPEFFVFSHSDDDDHVHKDTIDRTWGIDAVGGDRCHLTGRGIKLGILDTGFDKDHPDFVGRSPKMWSAHGCEGEDIQGHGTHCAGTAAGPRAVSERMRYGVASDADLHIYKVLNNSGYGSDGDVLAGIDQALADGCDVLSMSFGRGAGTGTAANSVYEEVSRFALESGCLIIAAAGNSSSRDLGYIAPVDYPANSPSIMAVAAIDSRLRVANFSCGGLWGTNGIDIAAPGAGVFSSAPMPRQYERMRGTSMAAPHVAGVACLWAESDPSLRGKALWDTLISNAQPLGIDKRDVGAGLVQAPFTRNHGTLQ